MLAKDINVSEPEPQSINIFPLADPLDWFNRRDDILKAIASAIGLSLPALLKPEYSFSLDPVCGWIRFTLHNDLWHERPKRALPRDTESALRAAREFIERLKQACRDEEFVALKIPPLLPGGGRARLAPVSTTPVFHPTMPWIDHWLCRFEIYLKPFDDGTDEVLVFGGGVDVRIGQNSKVVGFVSRWRPAWLHEARPARMFHLKDDHSDHEDPLRLVYELDGENCPQTFITPYYLSLEGHHGGMFPASSSTLIVETAFAEKTNGAVVVPRVFGGSGEYKLNWAYWRPDALFDEGLISEGEKEFIELSPGVYNVILHVEDRKTGVVKLHESMAFVKGEAHDTQVMSA